MGEVVDLTKKRIEKQRKEKLQKEMSLSIYAPRPKTKDEKLNDALKKYGSHRKNPNNDKDGDNA